jgi:hypothetical protein
MSIEKTTEAAITQVKLGELKNAFHMIASACESEVGKNVQTYSIGLLMPGRATVVANALEQLAFRLQGEAGKLRRLFD